MLCYLKIKQDTLVFTFSYGFFIKIDKFEPGKGWKWVTNLARYCNLQIKATEEYIVGCECKENAEGV